MCVKKYNIFFADQLSVPICTLILNSDYLVYFRRTTMAHKDLEHRSQKLLSEVE